MSKRHDSDADRSSAAATRPLHGRRRTAAPDSLAPATRRVLVASWSILALSATFVEAIHRLGARALRTISVGLDQRESVILCIVVVFFCYVEGYRALQKKFAPSVVARAFSASARLSGYLLFLCAPAYALSLIETDRRTMLRSWAGVASIIACVLAVRALPPVWRGTVDAGVASALAWGLLALLTEFSRVARKVIADSAGEGGRAGCKSVSAGSVRIVKSTPPVRLT